MFRGKAERKVEQMGYDPARLPPGQYLTEKWPVLHAGAVATYPDGLEDWDLRVSGEVENPLRLSWGELLELAPVEVTQDIHCVTRWSRFEMTFVGIACATVLELARPLPSARFAVAHAEAGFTANVPLEFLERDGALLATHADGEPLSPEHGFPLRLVVPGMYFWKSAKWLREIELLDHDVPGFWERLGYHNDADPFREQRYAF